MKHTIKIMIPFLMIAGLLTGCGSQVTTGSKAETTQATKTETTTAVSEQETQTETEQTPETTDAVTEAPEETTDETADSNILVVYYSAQEHTKGVAEIVADALGADVFVIEPVDIYTEDDLNWTNEQSRVRIRRRLGGHGWLSNRRARCFPHRCGTFPLPQASGIPQSHDETV